MCIVRRGLPAVILAVALIAAACSGGGGDGAGTGAGSEAAAAATAKIAVTLSDFKIEPSDIQVPAGQPLEFDVSNHGQSPHTFAVVVDGQQQATGEIAPGSTDTLAIDQLGVGTYNALCTIPGHEQLGMTATITAAEGASTGGRPPRPATRWAPRIAPRRWPT